MWGIIKLAYKSFFSQFLLKLLNFEKSNFHQFKDNFEDQELYEQISFLFHEVHSQNQ